MSAVARTDGFTKGITIARRRRLVAYIALAVALFLGLRLSLDVAGPLLLGSAVYSDVRADAGFILLVAQLVVAFALAGVLMRSWRRPARAAAAGARAQRRPSALHQDALTTRPSDMSRSFAESSVPAGPPERLLRVVFLIVAAALAVIIVVLLMSTGST